MFLRLSLIILLVAQASTAVAQSFVEYPAHPATYGDHVVNSTWVGGPTTVIVQLQTDESVLHADGVGQSQRTARNTLNYLAPSDPGNPQNYDDLGLVGIYGSRLPLLQHLAAAGVSTLSYDFAQPVTDGVDLVLADLDSSDDVRVRAFGVSGTPLDMTTWLLVAEGDLSLYKDTGTVFSPIVAPVPVTTFTSGDVRLTAQDGTNYNRSYSVLRAPTGTALERIEIEFTGIHNSPSRALGGNGSHVYVALSTPAQITATPAASPLQLVAATPARGVVPVWFRAPTSATAWIDVFDAAGRRVDRLWSGALPQARTRLEWNARNAAAGVYFVTLTSAGQRRVSKVMLLP